MEFFGLFLVIGIVGLTFWVFGKLIRAGWVFVTLPIKILFFLLGAVLFLLIVPLGVLAGLIGLIIPLGLALILVPVFLVGLGVALLSHR